MTREQSFAAMRKMVDFSEHTDDAMICVTVRTPEGYTQVQSWMNASGCMQIIGAIAGAGILSHPGCDCDFSKFYQSVVALYAELGGTLGNIDQHGGNA